MVLPAGEGEQVDLVGQPVVVRRGQGRLGRLGGLRRVGQLCVVQPLAQRAGVAVFDQSQVVDAGRGRQRCGLGAGLGVDVAVDPERHGPASRPAVVAHVDVGEVERVEGQLHPGPGQRRVDLVEVAVQADRRGRGDGAPFPPVGTPR